MLKLMSVSKFYGKHQVLDNINLDFEDPSGVYGLLGRNGVGKTTLMKIISNMITVYQGQITLEGQPLKNNADQLEKVVCVGGQVSKENYTFQGKIKNLLAYYQLLYPNFNRELADEMLAKFKLNPKDKFKKLSTGNQTLVQNIMGLACRAQVTILDEPTNGLDSVNRRIFFRFMMEDLAEYPRMFILSTHLIQEVENYLTHVMILKDRRVLLKGALEGIQKKSFRITNYQPQNKNIIHEEKLGSMVQYDVFDNLSQEEQQAIEAAGGQIERLDLQTLFNNLVEE